MTKQLALQTKEYMLEVIDWCVNPNRKLALEVINEVAETVLQDMDQYLKEEEKKAECGCKPDSIGQHLEDGKCPLHPNREVDIIEEENYFFRFSKYQTQLLKLYNDHPDFVMPAHRLEEIRNFVTAGLEDFSISRIKSKMPWGIPVPGDEDHVMYVWFDALINYISGANDNWPADLHLLGKDNGWFHTVIWPAMLLSAGLKIPKKIYVHSFLTLDGQKISKSLIS